MNLDEASSTKLCAENPDSCAVPDEHAGSEPHKHLEPAGKPIDGKAPKVTLESRVSTAKQGEKAFATSHMLQMENLRARAHRYGWEIVAENQSNVSGADANADRLQRLRHEAALDYWDIVAFDNVDRAFRSVLVGLQFVEEMIDAGKQVWVGDICVTEASSDEMFLFQVLLAASELKRNKNKDAAGHKAAKVRAFGMWYKKMVPFGYTRIALAEMLDDEGGDLDAS